MGAKRPPCRRCLLSDDVNRAAYATIADYIASLDPERKVDEAAYARRLAACRTCEHLHNALCAKCGCYVEVRCIKRALTCPDVPPRWVQTKARPPSPKIQGEGGRVFFAFLLGGLFRDADQDARAAEQ